MIQQTTALRKIASLKKKIRIVQGGQGAGKTISFLILICNHASSQPDREILIISAELTKMRLTVIKDFIKVMRMAGLYEEHRFLAGTLYKFPNGSFIKFIGLDKSDVGKGLRSDLAYFNELNKCDFESYRQIASRTKLVLADFNPDSEFFVHKELINRIDCDFIILSYKDNELLSESERYEIELYREKAFHNPLVQGELLFAESNIKSHYWSNVWKVYGMGQTGMLDGLIFKDWDKIDNIPEDAVLDCLGLDFGFTNSFTSIVAKYKWQGISIYHEVMYARQKGNREIAEALRQYSGIVPIYADSEDPRTINELVEMGIDVVKVNKPDGSVNFSIEKINENRFMITSSSKNGIKELESYIWAKDVNGMPLNKPEKKVDHFCDAMRYTELGIAPIETNYYVY